MPGIYICGHCNQSVFMGFRESHSNRCPLWGGHTEEQCPQCRSFYRPTKGQSSEVCPSCTTQLAAKR